MRVPCPLGKPKVTTPAVVVPMVGLAVATDAPVPHGGMITVRGASAVGTITARIPGLIALLELELLPIAPPMMRITSSATMTIRMSRWTPRPRSAGRSSCLSLFSAVSAIGLPP